MLWDMSFTPRGDVHPRRHSGTESFWAGISEALRKEGIVPGNTAPQAGSRCYWPCTTCLGHHQVTQPLPLPLLKGLSSQAHLVLYIRFLGTCVSESVGEVVPSADCGPTQHCWSGSEDARISRKFSDLSPLKNDSAWIWGASVEPGLGPTVHCSLSKHQPKTRLGMHKKENRYIMQLKATVGKVPTPPLPWDSIQDPLGGREC